MNILFVCTGNTCRSPMAEGYLKLKNIPDLNVCSRGIAADGSPVSKNSAKVMAEISVDISAHRSKQLDMSDLSRADKIICMAPSHLAVLSIYTSREKLLVLGGGIPDPYGNDEAVYRKCRDRIVKAIDELVAAGFFEKLYIASVKRENIRAIAELEKVCFSQPWSKQAISDSFENGTKFFAAVKGKRLLGYVGINCVLDEGYITNIAVLPQFRRQGIADALIERIFSLAKDTRLSFVSLEVRESNKAAISLYTKKGFKPEGKRRNFYREPAEDAIIMTKRFD